MEQRPQEGSIPFNSPHTTGREFEYVRGAIANGHLSGNGPFSARCSRWLEQRTGAHRALLTHSCTAALEMAVMLADVGPEDEVIMPSYTFVSTANAVVLRGGTPVFVDIREDTLNMDARLVEDAMTDRTAAIMAVHYAGVGSEPHSLAELAVDRNVVLIEDAAQSLLASYAGRPLGSFGALAALSFHETKNVHSGEGGALLVNDPELIERAEIIQEKGTNRLRYFRGQVDKYSWVDVGSSYAPSEINAAFLWAQLEDADSITHRRLAIWHTYHEAFADLETAGRVRRPIIPREAGHNAHLYYLLLPSLENRTHFIAELAQRGVHSVFHYVPLHSSEAGRTYGRAAGPLPITERVSDRIVRLPLWPDLTAHELEHVIDAVATAVEPASTLATRA